MITEQEHLRLAEGKMDASWERYFDESRVDIIDRYNTTLALMRGESLLDIGCGQFLLARLLQNSGMTMRFVGVDISPGEIAAAKRSHGYGKKDIELYQQDAESLTFANGEFDAVVIGQTLEHVRYPDRAADEAIRVLRQGGRLIVNVPNDDERPHGNHLHVFKELEDLLDLFGDAVEWQGKGEMHNFWFAWGQKK